MRAANARGEALKLSEDELAFYDTLEVNDSAVKVLGEPTLVGIARELVATVKKNVTIDWTVRENVRAQLRVIVKRILRKYGYPPDKQEKASSVALTRMGVRLGERPDQRRTPNFFRMVCSVDRDNFAGFLQGENTLPLCHSSHRHLDTSMA